jgi:hypothetical protein
MNNGLAALRPDQDDEFLEVSSLKGRSCESA